MWTTVPTNSGKSRTTLISWLPSTDTKKSNDSSSQISETTTSSLDYRGLKSTTPPFTGQQMHCPSTDVPFIAKQRFKGRRDRGKRFPPHEQISSKWYMQEDDMLEHDPLWTNIEFTKHNPSPNLKQQKFIVSLAERKANGHSHHQTRSQNLQKWKF